MPEGATQEAVTSAEKAKDWISSTQGLEEMKEMLRRAKETKVRLNKARRINPKRLHVPITL